MEWMILPLKRYAQFGGRSRRMEYWMFVLFTVIAGVVLGVLDAVLGLKFDGSGARFGGNGVLGSIFSLATLVPSIAVGVRRLHDTDRSGWWLLMPVVVVVVAVIAAFTTIDSSADMAGLGAGMMIAAAVAGVSGIVLLIFFCLDGTRGHNRFGPDPKDPAGSADLGDVFA